MTTAQRRILAGALVIGAVIGFFTGYTLFGILLVALGLVLIQQG